MPAEPALDGGSGTSARVPGGDPGVCRAPWEKRRGKDVEARVCSPSKCKGVNVISGEGTISLASPWNWILSQGQWEVTTDFQQETIIIHTYVFKIEHLAAVCKVGKRR